MGQNAVWSSGEHLKSTTAGKTRIRRAIRGRTLGRWVNWGPLHPTVIQGLKVRRTTIVGASERKDGREKWHVVRKIESVER